jgi:DNA-binding response OmpR family regulator
MSWLHDPDPGRRRPDLVLLDVQMPEMDGWVTLEEIRSHHGPWWPRVVMCTVKAHPKDVLRGWTLGCDAYLRKPFEIGALVDVVSGVVGAEQRDRERARAAGVANARHQLREYA